MRNVESWTRRRFLQTIGAAGTSAWFSNWAAAAERGETCVSVFFTTDLHGHILPTVSYGGEPDLGGLARCATRIREWQTDNPHHLLIDIGDVYQGTEVGLRTRGQVMIGALNALRYDGWVVGNHEFDWGMDAFAETLQHSVMPVLAANARLEGRAAGRLDSAQSPLGKIRPYFIKEVAGFRIAVIGLTTPGLPFWFQPSFHRGFEPLDPVESVRPVVEEVRAAGVDALIFAAHMGTRTEGDDYANRIDALTKAFPDATAVIAGHTHRNIPSLRVNDVLYSQANYYGINLGRLDLSFDQASRKLLRAEARTERMGPGIALDPQVLALTAGDLEDSEKALTVPVGTLGETFASRWAPETASDTARLIASGIFLAQEKINRPVDGVLHGTFGDKDLPAGPKTVGDMWTVIPFENFVVTGNFTAGQLTAVMNEVLATAKAPRSLMGIRVAVEKSGTGYRVTRLLDRDGNPLDVARRYRVAVNSYDAASGGQRLMALREILQEPEVNAVVEAVQTRDALIAFFRAHPAGVTRGDLLV